MLKVNRRGRRACTPNTAACPRNRTLVGLRGIGKTVMLGTAHDMAREHGWAAISETATSGFMGRIGESMKRLAELGDGPPVRRITAISTAGSPGGFLI